MRSRRPALAALAALALVAAATVTAAAAATAGTAADPLVREAAVRAAAADAPLEYPTGVGNAVRIAATPDGQGFYVLGSDGSVRAYGDAVARGNASLPHPAVAMAVTASG